MEDMILWKLSLFGMPFDITVNTVIQLAISILIICVAVYLARDLKKIPDKRQSVLELFVASVDKVVQGNMGPKYRSFVPFIGTLAVYLGLLNLVGLFGISPPTTDLNVAFGLSIISFIVIQANAIQKVGILHYFKGYASPVPVLLPINIMERLVFPVSLSLRLFGNMFAATIIMDLLYQALAHISVFAQFGLPMVLHAYFDVFDGTLQMVIFVMLTMINIKIVADH